MKISVIVAAYNAEQYLLEAMESALNQTIDDYEVIVINDGSTDSTLDILTDLSKDYNQLRIINKENGGPSSARNAGLEIAQGEFIYFIDADDILEMDALEKMYDRAIETEADMIIANYDIFSGDSVTKINNLKNLLNSANIPRFSRTILWTFSLWNKLFKKSIIDENNLRFPPISYSEDGVFTMRFVYHSSKIAGLNKVVYHYRRMYDGTGSSITASVNASKIKMYIQAHEWIYESAVKALETITKEELEIIDPKVYLGEIHRKEAQILLNQFYRNIWTLDQESIDLIINRLKHKMDQLDAAAFARIMSENNETALAHLSTNRKDILKHARFTAVLYGEEREKEDFINSLKSLVLQSLVETIILIPANMKEVAVEAGVMQDNVLTLDCTTKQDLYNKALEQSKTEFILFTECRYSYPAYTLKRMFKYMRKSPADMVDQTIYNRNFGENLPVYMNTVAFNTTKNGLYHSKELCLDYTLANKFFRVQYLKDMDIHFKEDPRKILPKMYDESYWTFLNDKLVLFDGDEDEFLTSIANEDTLAYAKEYATDRPVNLSDPAMHYDSATKYTKLMAYPKSKHGNGIRTKLVSYFRRKPIKNRTCFMSVRADDKLEGNALALYPHIEGEKVIVSRRLPHSYWYELKCIYYMLTSRVIITDDYVRYARWIRLRKGQRMIQLWHACGAFKMFGQRGTNMSVRADRATHAQYSLVSVSGPSIRSIYADAFDIPLSLVSSLGTPRTDVFFDEKYKSEIKEKVYEKLPQLRGKQVILYAPTFRDMGGNREIFQPELDFDKLSADLGPDQIFVICPHPIMKNDIIPHAYDNIMVCRNVSTNDMMFVSDMMITDYSSVVFEYALLRKPIAFFCYDLRLYDRGFFLKYPSDLPGEVYQTQHHLMKFISNPTQERNDKKYKEFIERYMAACDGHSCERIAGIVNAYLKEEKDEQN